MIGKEHGVNAASWWFDGNAAEFVHEATLRGIVQGDPMVLDSLPQSPLSGEWADSFSVRDLCDELGYDMDDRESHAFDTDETISEICSAYEQGFSEGSTHAIESACIDYLKGAGVSFDDEGLPVL